MIDTKEKYTYSFTKVLISNNIIGLTIYGWWTGKNILPYSIHQYLGRKLLFDLYYGFVYKSTYYCNTTLWDKYRSCKLLRQVHKFINIWYLNITLDNKSHHNTLAIGIKTTNRTYQIDYDIFLDIYQYLWGTCADDIT